MTFQEKNFVTSALHFHHAQRCGLQLQYQANWLQFLWVSMWSYSSVTRNSKHSWLIRNKLQLRHASVYVLQTPLEVQTYKTVTIWSKLLPWVPWMTWTAWTSRLCLSRGFGLSPTISHHATVPRDRRDPRVHRWRCHRSLSAFSTEVCWLWGRSQRNYIMGTQEAARLPV